MFSPIGIFVLICVLAAVVSGENLPADEVEALREIAETLRKTDWNFSVDPCSGQSGWITVNPPEDFENAVTCNCSFLNSTVCHVVSIVLKSQNLTGIVPKELVRLPFLNEIDLTRNYLNGTIPSEWGSMRLRYISLEGNRVTGSIPRELANISTLLNITLDCNHLSGAIPPELGHLPQIQKISLNSNNLTGELPESLGNLTTLTDFRISDNNFTGRIPHFIQSWTHIARLEMHASGLSGPIPSVFASLMNLIDLRISDLDGNDSSFPLLSNISKHATLVLRSCNIVGVLPFYLGQRNFEHLDLSFNKLTGPVPDSFSGLSQTNYLYLTGNSLDGQVPQWMTLDGNEIDLSYNNLSSESFSPNCQRREVNLFASSKGHTNGIASCLQASSCNHTISSLHINCGGEEIATGSYVKDTDSGGASHVFQDANWAFSNTGKILDVVADLDTYIVKNRSSIITPNPELYTDARVSSLSLTYYLFCLQNRSYSVKLHFAEIMFTNDRTFSSLGRRLFDIYIQGNLVKKDFNIESEADGVNRAITLNFPANVIDGALDIRFYWAGKGTKSIPQTGVYGPLISAISVDPDTSRNGISVGAIVSICVGVLLGVMLILGIPWWKGCLRPKETLENELKSVDLHTMLFTLRQIKAATNNFNPANKIGQGGFGPVYKGLLSDGTAIAVKQLSSTSKQGNREFVTEIGMVSAVQHPNLVKLYGCCIDGNQLFLIYEYLENNSLSRALLGSEEHQLALDWPTRRKICIGIARGLAYLHEESRLKIVHRDIKVTNVLLDKNMNPKISDFGLAKLNDEDRTHMTTRVAGTYGYMAPEYAMRGYLTDKVDVYSFGVVLLEVISGRSITTIKIDDHFYLLDWAISLKASGNFLELVDPKLDRNFNDEEVFSAIKVALDCTNDIPSERPSMSTVVSLLEGAHDSISDSHNVSVEKMDTKEITALDNCEGKGASVDLPLACSSTPDADLYSITLHSEYY